MHASRWTVGLVLAALSFATATLSSGTWCLGSDGHVAIELTASGKCVGIEGGAGAATPAPSLRASTQPGDHCGPCTDLDRPAAEWLTGSKPSVSDADGVVAMAGSTACLAIPPMAQHPGVARRDSVAPTRESLRSSVLRC